MTALDLATIRAALGDLAASFTVDGDTLLCGARDHAEELLREGKRRLERAGLCAMQAGRSLYVSAPAAAEGKAQPWEPRFYERPAAKAARIDAPVRARRAA